MSSQAKVQRVGIYLRVSTMDQEAQNQLLQLQALCDQLGWRVFKTYVDVESGRKGKRERAEFAELFRDASKHRFDLVLFWSLDRFSREGITKTIAYWANSTGRCNTSMEVSYGTSGGLGCSSDGQAGDAVARTSGTEP